MWPINLLIVLLFVLLCPTSASADVDDIIAILDGGSSRTVVVVEAPEVPTPTPYQEWRRFERIRNRIITDEIVNGKNRCRLNCLRR